MSAEVIRDSSFHRLASPFPNLLFLLSTRNKVRLFSLNGDNDGKAVDVNLLSVVDACIKGFVGHE